MRLTSDELIKELEQRQAMWEMSATSYCTATVKNYTSKIEQCINNSSFYGFVIQRIKEIEK